MRRLAFLFLFIALGAGVVAQAAAAEPLRANVVSVSPNDIDQPDVPVSIVFRLYNPQLPSPQPDWGKPVGGVNDVEVVVHGQGQTGRFPTEDLGGGRYRTEIVFPEPGGWTVRVSYAAGSYGAGDEIDLGKGAICIAADCIGPQPGETAPADSNGQPWTTMIVIIIIIIIIIAAALALALVAVALVRFGAIGPAGGAWRQLRSAVNLSRTLVS